MTDSLVGWQRVATRPNVVRLTLGREETFRPGCLTGGPTGLSGAAGGER